MVTVCFYEMLVSICESTQCHNPEEQHCYPHHYEDLKYHIIYTLFRLRSGSSEGKAVLYDEDCRWFLSNQELPRLHCEQAMKNICMKGMCDIRCFSPLQFCSFFLLLLFSFFLLLLLHHDWLKMLRLNWKVNWSDTN
jgi:hypothetical protein